MEYKSNRKQINLSFDEKTNQSANLNSCFSAIDYIVESISD